MAAKTSQKSKFKKNGLLFYKKCQLTIIYYFQYVQTDPPSKETLSQLVIQLIQYQETKLGKNAQDSSMTTRLPVSIT